ncbi:predicted protein [Sclerotinia sclerotiorum 1980 UF-70]|uniref:Uncharacterized protein n=1 Tax=Sclerotinia sclerotiorum (strain ATCC 18683 / 1980 / Ss-1) TaxID=665079 RepID=A7F7T7_SCLS1|nr:predicted protein [Sclerotinia sclerotiorum 1980 UF-70]EDN98808.1 predicted protein [Sclerotinia sclerotiorum 1980 UF-70]
MCSKIVDIFSPENRFVMLSIGLQDDSFDWFLPIALSVHLIWREARRCGKGTQTPNEAKVKSFSLKIMLSIQRGTAS